MPRSSRKKSLVWRWIYAAEGVALLVLGVVALIGLLVDGGLGASHEFGLLGLALNSVHAALFVLLGVVILATATSHGPLLMSSGLCCVGFVFLFLYGTAESSASKERTWLLLDPDENFMHAGLAVVNFVVFFAAATIPWWNRRSQKLLGSWKPPDGAE